MRKRYGYVHGIHRQSSGIFVSISDGELIEDDTPGAHLAPPTLDFGAVPVGLPAETQNVVLTNPGTAPLTIEGISVTGEGYSQENDCGESLEPGEFCTIEVSFSPAAPGPHIGELVLDSDAPFSPAPVALTGVGEVVMLRLSTSGNQFVDPIDRPVRLKSANWFGAEGTNYTPHGTWERRYTDILDQIRGFGFNCIRLPFSGDFTAPGRTPPGAAIDFEENPEFEGLTSLEIFDLIIDYCGEIGLYVVLDHHRRNAGDGADGSPIGGGYTAEDWIASWTVMADRYKDNPTVVGADLHNEPHNLSWGAWADLFEECAEAIHLVAPEWIMFCEGVGDYDDQWYWWGGQLAGVRDRPISLSFSNKLAYSPHEYGQSVGSQSWLAYDGQTPPAGWPDNLYEVWPAAWSFIFYEGIAPIWIGEFGGFFGVDGDGNATKPHGAFETQWMEELAKFMNGDRDGDGQIHLPPGQLGMSFAFWSYNPNSGDTGGLVQDDWVTPQQVKLDIIAPLLHDPEPIPVVQLTDEEGNIMIDEDGFIITGDGNG